MYDVANKRNWTFNCNGHSQEKKTNSSFRAYIFFPCSGSTPMHWCNNALICCVYNTISEF